MTEIYITKQRPIWNPRSLQLLRERGVWKDVSIAISRNVDGILIEIPETKIAVGLHILASSRRIFGQSLFETLYIPGMQEYALEMAIIALKALYTADLPSKNKYLLFGRFYTLVRILKVHLSELLDPPQLSSQQRDIMNHLLAKYIKNIAGKNKLLVHGDLHAGNLVVNHEKNTLGIVDLEMIHIGKPIINFAQLWISFYFASPELGYELYQSFNNHFPEIANNSCDLDLRAEIALRSYFLESDAKKNGNSGLEKLAHELIDKILYCEKFDSVFQC